MKLAAIRIWHILHDRGIQERVPADVLHAVDSATGDAGFPVCVLRADPADDKKWDQDAMTAAVEDLIVNRIIPNQEKKKAE